jgi:pyruvate dehydrogenase phosphatase
MPENSSIFTPTNYKRFIDNFNGPYISANPEIIVHELSPEEDKFIVMATDGLWDELTSKDVGNILFKNNFSNKEFSEKLFYSAMHKAASAANMSLDDIFRVPSHMRRRIHDDITLILINLNNYI